MTVEPIQESFCIAYGCEKSTTTDTTFYQVPEDDEIRQKWLIAIGRDDLIDEKVVSYQIVCSDHFNDILKQEPEPTKNISAFNDTDPSAFILENKPLETTIDTTSCVPSSQLTVKSKCKITFESDDEADTAPGNQKNIADKETQTSLSICLGQKLHMVNLQLGTIKKYRKQIKELKGEIKALKRKILPKELAEKINNLLKWKKYMATYYKNKHNTIEFKLFALNLYISSRYLYKHLNEILNLPSLTDLKDLKVLQPASAKINYKTLNCLATKIKSLPDNAKYCGLLIDKVDLKRHLYYNITKDEIIGLHNFRGHVTNTIASAVYFIMIRGIAFEWKQLVSYIFLSEESLYIDLDIWIQSVIMELSSLGLKILAITSSQKLQFMQYAEYKLVTVDKPFFEVEGQKIYYIFDAPNWLTCLRNDLIENNFYYENQTISWSHIEALYAYKKQNLMSVLHNLTDAHVTPSLLEREEVKYAAQIFSRSVFSTFDILIQVKFIPKEVKLTTEFIKTINDVFDVLNSKTIKCDNEYKCAFNGSDKQVEALTSARKMIKSLHSINKARKIENTTEIDSFKSIQITILSLVRIFRSCKELGVKQILTSRLNKEPLDNFKKKLLKDQSKVAPIRFTRVFEKQFILQILPNAKTDKKGCDILELAEKGNFVWGTTAIPWTGKEPMISAITPVLLYEFCDYRFQLPKQQPFTYVTSYLLYKCSLKHKCPDFDKMHSQCPPIKLKKDINLTYPFSGQLKIPHARFYNSIRELDDAFQKSFSSVVVSKPANQLVALLHNTFVPPCECFPTDYLLALFVRFKIYSVLLYNRKVPSGITQEIVINTLLD